MYWDSKESRPPVLFLAIDLGGKSTITNARTRLFTVVLADNFDANWSTFFEARVYGNFFCLIHVRAIMYHSPNQRIPGILVDKLFNSDYQGSTLFFISLCFKSGRYCSFCHFCKLCKTPPTTQVARIPFLSLSIPPRLPRPMSCYSMQKISIDWGKRECTFESFRDIQILNQNCGCSYQNPNLNPILSSSK